MQPSLFGTRENCPPENVLPFGGEVFYYPDFLSAQESHSFFERLLAETNWQQDQITIFGKTMDIPRLTALYGTEGSPYSYSGITMVPNGWTETLLEIKRRIEAIAAVEFTTVLINLYRDGRDSNGWHSDDEKELGTNPVIGSVSFGAERNFKFRFIKDKTIKRDLILTSGSLVLMRGETQHNWQHEIPKSKKVTIPRINLTFRVIHTNK